MNSIKRISCGAILVVCAISATLASCGSDNPEPKTEGLDVKRHTQSRATSPAGDPKDWVYFSFATVAEVSGVTEANRMSRSDWAIAFSKGAVKHVFFVAETKGTMDTLQLDTVEQSKIECAKKLFSEMSTEDVRYYHVATYDQLLGLISNLK